MRKNFIRSAMLLVVKVKLELVVAVEMFVANGSHKNKSDEASTL
jgi:hypothetical protein